MSSMLTPAIIVTNINISKGIDVEIVLSNPHSIPGGLSMAEANYGNGAWLDVYPLECGVHYDTFGRSYAFSGCNTADVPSDHPTSFRLDVRGCCL